MHPRARHTPFVPPELHAQLAPSAHGTLLSAEFPRNSKPRPTDCPNYLHCEAVAEGYTKNSICQDDLLINGNLMKGPLATGFWIVLKEAEEEYPKDTVDGEYA